MITIKPELMQQAQESVESMLPYPIELMTQFKRTDMPSLTRTGTVFGPASDNACAWEQYGPEWTGLAVGSVLDSSPYWFLGRCRITGERTFNCLGPKPTVAAAIEAAIERTYIEHAYWANDAESKSQVA